MKKIFLITLIFFQINTVSSQYTDIINSKRPGISESPYGVGTKVLQVETGMYYQNNRLSKNTFLTDSYGANVFLRYGNFLEKLEVNVDFSYQYDDNRFNNIFESKINTNHGIKRLSLGAKYLVYNVKYTDKSKEIHSWKARHAFDWKRVIPSVGVAVAWNSNFLNEEFKQEGMSLKGAILLQNDINERFVILTNLSVDGILLDTLEYAYIITSTLAVNNKWSVFGEHQGVFNAVQENEFWFGAGTAYLVNNNMQVDISARTSLVSYELNDFYAGLGVSWRLDRHTVKKEEKEIKGAKESFFKRLFKKKKKKKGRLRTIKTKKRKTKIKRSRKPKKGTPSFQGKKEKKKKKRRKRKKD